jgi:steroid delta-isomerase-like uncharacterized protein
MADLKSLVEKHYDNVATADMEAEREIFAPDVVTVDPGAGTIEGLEGFLAYERGFHDAFPDGHMEVKSWVEGQGCIAVQGVFTGTQTGAMVGPGGEIPPTNRRLELPFGDFFQVSGGRITRHEIYYDQVTFLSQLGLMPAPAGA